MYCSVCMHFWFMYMVVLHILLFLFLSIFILFLRSALFYCFLCCKPFWVCVLNDLSSYHYFRKCCLQWQYVPYLGSRSQFPGMYPRWECSIFILKMSELFWKLFFFTSVAHNHMSFLLFYDISCFWPIFTLIIFYTLVNSVS